MKALSPQMLALLDQKQMPKEFADPHPHLQGRIGARGLEAGYDRPFRAAQGLSDLPLVGRSRPEGQGRRSPGARGLLHDHARPDESEFQLLSRDQYRLPQRFMTAPTTATARF